MQEQWSAHREDPSAPRDFPRSIARLESYPALGARMPNFKLPTWNFRLFLPTLHLREQIENFRVLIGKRVSSYGAQTISIDHVVVSTHRALSVPSVCSIELSRLTGHTLWLSSQRAKGTYSHSYDCQSPIRVTQQPAYPCLIFILFSSSCVPRNLWRSLARRLQDWHRRVTLGRGLVQ